MNKLNLVNNEMLDVFDYVMNYLKLLRTFNGSLENELRTMSQNSHY